MQHAKQLETNVDELRGMPPPLRKPDPDRNHDLIWGVHDRLVAHDRAIVNVVLAPADEDGKPDWDRAAPTNLESLPNDEWPQDAATAARVAILVDQIDGCDPETATLVFLAEEGPSFIHIAGPAGDASIAEAIIGRDIGAKPKAREQGPIAASFAKLAEELFPKKVPVAANDNKPDANRLRLINPADWYDRPVPTREWYAEDLIPNRQVTIVNGDGGVGKSLLSLQIAAVA